MNSSTASNYCFFNKSCRKLQGDQGLNCCKSRQKKTNSSMDPSQLEMQRNKHENSYYDQVDRFDMESDNIFSSKGRTSDPSHTQYLDESTFENFTMSNPASSYKKHKGRKDFSSLMTPPDTATRKHVEFEASSPLVVRQEHLNDRLELEYRNLKALNESLQSSLECCHRKILEIEGENNFLKQKNQVLLEDLAKARESFDSEIDAMKKKLDEKINLKGTENNVESIGLLKRANDQLSAKIRDLENQLAQPKDEKSMNFKSSPDVDKMLAVELGKMKRQILMEKEQEIQAIKKEYEMMLLRGNHLESNNFVKHSMNQNEFETLLKDVKDKYELEIKILKQSHEKQLSSLSMQFFESASFSLLKEKYEEQKASLEREMEAKLQNFKRSLESEKEREIEEIKEQLKQSQSWQKDWSEERNLLIREKDLCLQRQKQEFDRSLAKIMSDFHFEKKNLVSSIKENFKKELAEFINLTKQKYTKSCQEQIEKVKMSCQQSKALLEDRIASLISENEQHRESFAKLKEKYSDSIKRAKREWEDEKSQLEQRITKSMQSAMESRYFIVFDDLGFVKSNLIMKRKLDALLLYRRIKLDAFFPVLPGSNAFEISQGNQR